jgi:hypothetical protein
VNVDPSRFAAHRRTSLQADAFFDHPSASPVVGEHRGGNAFRTRKIEIQEPLSCRGRAQKALSELPIVDVLYPG